MLLFAEPDVWWWPRMMSGGVCVSVTFANMVYYALYMFATYWLCVCIEYETTYGLLCTCASFGRIWIINVERRKLSERRVV